MKHLRIEISNREERARGVVEMSRRGRFVRLQGNQFIVPEPALAMLDSMNIHYHTIGEEDSEAAVRAVRDSIASPYNDGAAKDKAKEALRKHFIAGVAR